MRVMILHKGDIPAGSAPKPEFVARMRAYLQEVAAAGLMVEGVGLKSSGKGKRVAFGRGGRKEVIDGPFTETKELLAGFSIWNVKSLDEAVEWVKKMPMPDEMPPGVHEHTIEIRPVFEPGDTWE